MEMHVKGSDMKIKDLSSVKCHKEIKDTWFSSDFVAFNLWPYY
jgi:hypothetical protein